MSKQKNSKAAASSSEGAAALAEVADGPRTIEWEGVTLTLRKAEDVPDSVLFDLVEFQENPSDLNALKLIKVQLEPESYQLARITFASLDDTEGALLSLFRAVSGAEPGESEASAES